MRVSGPTPYCPSSILDAMDDIASTRRGSPTAVPLGAPWRAPVLCTHGLFQRVRLVRWPTPARPDWTGKTLHTYLGLQLRGFHSSPPATSESTMAMASPAAMAPSMALTSISATEGAPCMRP